MRLFSSIFKKSAEVQSVSEKKIPAKKPDSVIDTSVGKVTVNVSMSMQHNEPDIPPLQGDYAKTVFLWAFSKPSPIRVDNSYAAYFLYECGIRDCVKYHQKLIEEGYLIEAEPGEVLNSFKLPELKEMLKELDQPVSGKKAVLIDRIIENVEDDFLRIHCPEKMYKPSAEGMSFLKAHDDYIRVHKHKNWGVSWQEYDRYAKPGQDYLTTMWNIFSSQLKKASLQESRSLYYYQYSILMEQGKRSDALEILLKVFYLDLSGVLSQSMFNMYREKFYTKKELKEYANVALMLAPGLVAALGKFEDIYDPEMVDMLFDWKLPVQICDKELFREIIEKAIRGLLDEELANRKLKTAYNRFVDRL